jgi:hypothetical protein
VVDQALNIDVVYSQPIIYELTPLVSKKAFFFVGGKDTTALGNTRDYRVCKGCWAIIASSAGYRAESHLDEIHGSGTCAVTQALERFHKALTDWLRVE